MADHDLIQHRRDTSANWSSVNPILADGEFGVITDATPRQIKLGDGVTPWNSLPMYAPQKTYGSIWWKTAGTFTFIAPSDKLVIHAGAAGGGGNSNYGLAGGAGQCIVGRVVSTIKGEVITVNVGLGGKGAVGGKTGGGIAAIAASNGGNTTISGSFGTITLIGGFGGCYDGMLNPGQPGGDGGQRGEFCSSYSIDSRYTRHGGRGGDSEFGKGGMGGYYADNPTTYGNLAHGEKGGPAAGGGGGGNIFGASITATNGGDGGDGIVIFEWEAAA